MQKIKAVLFLPVLLVAMSFTDDKMMLETKTYDVCGCEKATPASPKIELTLRPDHTFHYENAADPSKKLNIKGSWEMNGQKVVLRAEATENGFHKNWKFDKNQPCIMSRKGLNFIRLCDIESCK